MSMRVQLILEAIDRASRPIAAVTKALLGADRAAKAGEGLNKIGRGLAGIGKTAAIAGVAIAGVATTAAIGLLETARGFERFEVQLTSLEGSQEKGRAAMAWISEFAGKTPLELDEVMNAYAQMKAYGLDPTNGSMLALVDTMARSGKGADHLSGLIMALGQANTKGKLQGEEALQLIERGVPVWELLGKHYGKTAAQMQEMASKGKLGRDAIEVLTKAMGVQAAGASEEMSKTFDGMISNMSDAWYRFQLAVMQGGLFDWMKGRLGDALNTVNRMAADGSLKAWATQIGQSIQRVLEIIWAMGVGIVQAFQAISPYVAAFVEMVGGARNAMLLLAGLAILKPLLLIGQGIGLLISALVPFGPALIVAGTAMKAFGLSLLATPVGWFMAAIAVIAGGAYLIYRNWGKIGPWLSGVWNSVTGILSDGWAKVTAWFSGIQWPSLPEFSLANLASFDGLTDGLRAGWAAVKGWFASVQWPAFPAFDLSVLDGVKAVLDGLISWFDGWGGRVSASAGKAFNAVSGIAAKAADGIGAAFNAVSGGLASASEMVFGPSAASVSASAADIDKISQAARSARALIDAVPPAASAAVGAASSILASANFHSHGVSMMTTLAAGIRAGAASAVAAAAATVTQIRAYLPHSPAKVGPLSDLDRVQFGQTLAGAMRAGAPQAIAAAAAIAAGVAATLPGNAAFAAPAFGKGASTPRFALPGISEPMPQSGSRPAGSVSSGGAMTLNLTFAPVINGGADKNMLAQLKALLPELGYEIGEIVKRESARLNRVKH